MKIKILIFLLIIFEVVFGHLNFQENNSYLIRIIPPKNINKPAYFRAEVSFPPKKLYLEDNIIISDIKNNYTLPLKIDVLEYWSDFSIMRTRTEFQAYPSSAENNLFILKYGHNLFNKNILLKNSELDTYSFKIIRPYGLKFSLKSFLRNYLQINIFGLTILFMILTITIVIKKRGQKANN